MTNMTDTDPNQDKAQIRQVLNAYHTAMEEANTQDLDQLVAADYSLVHITGYIQPKAEWFGVIRSGAFDYHRIELDQQTLTLNLEGDTATVTGRGIFNATIQGMKNPWRLQFTLQFTKQGGRWIIQHARYSSF